MAGASPEGGTVSYVCPTCRQSDQLVAAFHEHVEYRIIALADDGDGYPVISELGEPEILGDVYSQSDGLYCNRCDSSLDMDDLEHVGDAGPFDTERGKHEVGE